LKKLAKAKKAAIPTRREPRIQHLNELHVCYEGGGADIYIRVPDLSPNGMFVNTSTHFPEGAVVNMRFSLTHSNVEVQTRGEVRYCLPGTGIGVEFLGLDAKSKKAIEQELKAFTRSSKPRKNLDPLKARKAR
jgi:Tfp pilus assembly protein PilZ